jgi:hypothetical protein
VTRKPLIQELPDKSPPFDLSRPPDLEISDDDSIQASGNRIPMRVPKRTTVISKSTKAHHHQSK